ncbi:phosphoesterase RecJ domain-containing protein [Natronincola peptidivorans]|uniref:Phosphoesterase RecJ domain-containing protein n=1 Tax=Natronincola peptidivorans TaxID=426128 RepID=A0A1H9YJ80_9FIRM|nr:bifunctional oligoribonuclease/PAP phosphatase NrnA [Natronincola peptidivorans]SES68554.1 phosphoesterase RecJ domain-containing protein [Natronincola peptidivorans]
MKAWKNNPLALVEKNNTIAVISHVEPDGDSLGSLLGLGLALKKICGSVYIFINDDFPQKYKFLPGYKYITTYDNSHNMDFDFCFVLDCGDLQRLGYSQSILSRSQNTVNVDHHISNTEFGSINILQSDASSTCEIIYDLLEDFQLQLDVDIATCLYIGLATDTGNFVYDNTTAKTFRVAADLMNYNINLNDISYNLYQNKSINNIRFLGHILKHMEISSNGKIAMIMITNNLLEEYNVTINEIDSVINYARDIKGVEIAVMLKEIEGNQVKAGFRSKQEANVSTLAQKFGGGGHKKASGATIKGNVKEAREKIEKQIRIDLGW